MTPVPIVLQPKTVLSILLSCIGLLVLAHLIGMFLWHVLGHDRVFGLIRLFRLDGERNFPTLFSTLQLFVASGSLAIIGSGLKIHRCYWYSLALIFLFLTADEYIGFHELLAVSRGKHNPGMTLQFAWLAPYLVGTIALCVLFIPFLRRLPRRTTIFFCVSGGIYVGAALGLEAVTGLVEEAGYPVNDVRQRLVATVEETLEMASISVFIYAQLDYIYRSKLPISIFTWKPENSKLNVPDPINQASQT